MESQRPQHRLALCLALVVMGAACASAPKGWRAVPPAAELRLAGGPPPEAAAVEVSEAFFAGEIPLAQAAARIAELQAKTRPRARLEEAAAYVALLQGREDAAWLHFLQAAADVTADATALYLVEATARARTVGQLRATLTFLDDLAHNHPSPEVRALAAHLSIADSVRLELLEDVPAAREATGLLDDWQLIGAFDNDQGKAFLTPLAPERGVRLDDELDGALLPVRWREPGAQTHSGLVSLGNLVHPSEHAAAYLATWVQVPADTEAQLRLTTTSAVRAWVNDALVLSEERMDRGRFDNLRVGVSLRAGWNQLLIKAANKEGSWQLGARLTDAEGAPLPGLVSSSSAKAYRAAATPKPAPAVSRLPAGLADLGDGARARFLRGRALQLWGHARPAVDELQSFVEAHPKSLPGTYWAAVALEVDGEEGKAIDLLNRGLELSEEKAARFFDRRSTFYVRKRQLDKAQADRERAVELAGRSRRARIQLASVYSSRGFHVDRCRLLDEVVRENADDGWAIRELGLCWSARGYSQRALQLWQRAAALEPGHVWGTRRLLEVARRRMEYAEAQRLAVKLQRLQPARGRHLIEEGDIRRVRGDDEGADGLYRAAHDRNPHWPTPLRRLGLSAYERGDVSRALDFWRATQERNPDDSQLADLVEHLAPTGLGFAERWAPSDEEVEKVIAGARQVKPHPGAQVLTLMDDEVTEVSQDGSSRRLVTTVSMALNKHGRDALIQERVPGRGKLKLLKSYSIRPDGQRQEASSIRGGVVRFRSLEVGSIVVLQYVHYARSQRFLPNHFVGEWYFQTVPNQMVRSRWVLALPEDRHLKVRVQGDVSQREERVEGRHVRIFEARDVPPLLAEPFMPPPTDLLRKVSVTTVKDWEEYVAWERALLSQVFRLDSETRALAKKLVQGAETPREKFDRLYHYVAQEIRYQQDYESTIAGVRPHACPVVLARGYGDCKDKAVLLILLAREVGVDVDFAILRTTDAGRVLKEIPNQQFNHAIVYVPKQSGIEEGFFMDPTTDGLDMGNLRADDQGAWSLVLDPEAGAWKFREIPYQAPDLQFQKYEIDIRVASPEAAEADAKVIVRGSAGSSLRRVLRNEEQAKKLYQASASRLFVGATVKEASSSDPEDIWSPLVLDLDLDVSGALTPDGKLTRLPLPSLFPLSRTAMLSERRHPIRLGAPDSMELKARITLPPGSRVTHAPADVSIEHPCFSVARTSEVKGASVEVHMRYAATCPQLPADGYAEYRKAVQRATAQLNDPLRFELKKTRLTSR
jgi:tetratricopeptide (TPR) repeat protein/transglutaminase-like putative cysteine protease